MTTIEKYRNQIDQIDKRLLELLVERFACSVAIGRIKAEHNLSPLQSSRWEDIISTRKIHGSELGLQDEFIEKLLELIHLESIRIQDDVIKGPTDVSR